MATDTEAKFKILREPDIDKREHGNLAGGTPCSSSSSLRRDSRRRRQFSDVQPSGLSIAWGGPATMPSEALLIEQIKKRRPELVKKPEPKKS
jgi:hypothetical protein